MNEGFPPLVLAPPESRPRRKETGRSAPLSAEVLAKRAQIAQVLDAKLQVLSSRLKSLTPAERRAVFYKLEHEGAVDPVATLSGTDLKPVAHPSPDVVYAVPKEGNLEKLIAKVDAFATAPVSKQHVPNEWVAGLKDIKEADPRDRLSDDLRADYAALVRCKWVICEIEFLSLLGGPKQQKQEIEGWLAELSRLFAIGVHGSVFEHEVMPPTCRAVIRCTGPMLRTLVEDPVWIARIRWIESRPKFQTFKETLEEFRFQDLAAISSPARDAPVVCIVDSGVTAGNPFLIQVVQPELSRSFLKKRPDNPNDENGHGSAVASLASYYSLNIAAGGENQPRVWIASARILDADNQIEDERLFSKVLEEVVEFYSKLDVRIFCLAVADTAKVWSDSSRRSIPRKSWVARRIDQLSRQYDVVFVTCTGNLTRADIAEFAKDSKEYPSYLIEPSAHILDPGQAALALTVGSVAATTKIVLDKDAQAVALRNQPSPFTRSGPGIRREIKPEVVEYGGNLAFDPSLRSFKENRGLQVVSASKQLTPAIAFWSGTSFAAPRVAHRLALIDQDLKSLGIRPSASLLRAFLVNSAALREERGEIAVVREALGDRADELELLLGHGLPDHLRATGCDEYSVVGFFQGEIEPDHVMFFDVPVPVELAGNAQQRRLTVTVAHAPEVQRWGLERYCGAEFKWRMFRGDKSRDEIVDAMSEAEDESDEETATDLFASEDAEEAALPKELGFSPGVMKRSRGTLQHASLEWGQHRKEYSASHYTLAIAAYKRWKRTVENIPFGVVVRLEDLGRQIPIYASVQTSIEVRTGN